MTSVQSAGSKVDVVNEVARSRAALLQLPAKIQQINRVYLSNVERRSLLTATEAAAWLDREVIVFLRHDKIKVFAIESNDEVAMADFLTLVDVQFHVDEFGRQQSNADAGPLPNFRTVHAYLTGQLCRIADHGIMPDRSRWQPVQYNPINSGHFVLKESGMAIAKCNAVQLTPGTDKVWCPRPDDPVGDYAVARAADSGGSRS